MKYVLLIHEQKITVEQIAKLFERNWDLVYSNNSINICDINKINKRDSYVWLDYSQDIENDYEIEEKAIFSELKYPKFALVNYRNDIVLRKVLKIISHNIHCYIDNDYGTILKGTDFMEKWSRDWSDNATRDWHYEYW